MPIESTVENIASHWRRLPQFSTKDRSYSKLTRAHTRVLSGKPISLSPISAIMQNIILASGSIYRKQQLERLKVRFSTSTPDVDEDVLKAAGLDHVELSVELSYLKARSVSRLHNDVIVIGGDQVVSFNGSILSKPKTKERAFEQLRALAGNEHQLITSLVICANGQEYLTTCIAGMKMRQLSDEQLIRYIDIDEPLHSCGSYRLEALGISLFESVECEDYSSIIGIPLMWTAKTLTEIGVPIP